LNVNQPEYPSAHSCWTQAVTETRTYFFGTDEAEFGLDRTVTGSTRQYARFSEVAEEVEDARVWDVRAAEAELTPGLRACSPRR
jgi:hypothetical protein